MPADSTDDRTVDDARVDTGRGLPRRLDPIEARLSGIERAIEELQRRQVVTELRNDPGRLLSGVGDTGRIVREDSTDLSEALARWDVPLSIDEARQLQRTSLVAQAVTGPHGAKIHLVVRVVVEARTSDLESIADAARLLSSRSRRALPVLVTLRPPDHDTYEAAAALGVEIAVDD